MRVVFLGSGTFAIPSLRALLDAGYDVAAVVTQPDRERGRGRDLAPPPIKPIALEPGIPILQPRRVRSPEAQAAIRALAPELQVVVAYGQILPKGVIEIPPRGTINVHASLLPRYRGAAPIQWAIVNGEHETGVTTMLIDEGLDTGPLLLTRSTAILPEETAPELEARLAVLGAELLIETIRGLESEVLRPRPQDGSRATHAPMIRKEEGRIDWQMSSTELARRVRGFHPWPGTTATCQGRDLKILRAVADDAVADAEPGTLIALNPDGVLVACGQGTCLRLIQVQPESRRAMPASAFVSGARLRVGDRLA